MDAAGAAWTPSSLAGYTAPSTMTMNLSELLATPPPTHPDVQVSPEAVQATLDYLASAAALASLARDPYWPKWDSPWWHMALLHELGLSPMIPAAMARTFLRREWQAVLDDPRHLREG